MLACCNERGGKDHGEPAEINTDKSHVLARVIADVVAHAEDHTDQYASARIESDHGRLKSRLRPVPGLKRDRTASVVIRCHDLLRSAGAGALRVNQRNSALVAQLSASDATTHSRHKGGITAGR